MERIVDLDCTGEPVVTQTSAVRAAEYVRMSTEHQQYSTENQRDRTGHATMRAARLSVFAIPAGLCLPSSR